MKLQASDIHAMFHGVNTFMQLILLYQEEGIPPIQIHDWPSFNERGVLLDLSKGRIPTMVCAKPNAKILNIAIKYLPTHHFKVNSVAYVRTLLSFVKKRNIPYPFSIHCLLGTFYCLLTMH